MEATWNPGECMASVTKHKGKVLSTMGVTIQGKLMLFPEEIVYLIHKHGLRLLDEHGHDAISTNTLLAQTSSHPLHDKTMAPVYFFLKERDFVVRRFGVPSRLSSVAEAFAGLPVRDTALRLRFSVYNPSVASRTSLAGNLLFHVAPSQCIHDVPDPTAITSSFMAANNDAVCIAVADADGNVLLFDFRSFDPCAAHSYTCS